MRGLHACRVVSVLKFSALAAGAALIGRGIAGRAEHALTGRAARADAFT
jgi:hypothetical protein